MANLNDNLALLVIGVILIFIGGLFIGIAINKFREGKFDAKSEPTEEEILDKEWKDQNKGYK